jgi:hypothetical protein
MISRSRFFAPSAESRTVVGGGSSVSKAASGRELAERVGRDRRGRGEAASSLPYRSLFILKRIARLLSCVQSLGPVIRRRYVRAMCGRALLSSDVSEIKLVFSIPPDRPTPTIWTKWRHPRSHCAGLTDAERREE